MDSNLMNCPTCGHSVSTIAGACTYCGAMMEVQQPLTNEDDGVNPVQGVESPPSLPREETSPADEIRTETDKTDADAEIQTESNTSQQFPESQGEEKKPEATAWAENVSADEPAAAGEEAESKPVEEEQTLESQPENKQPPPNKDDSSEITSSEDVGSEPEHKTESEPAAAEKPDTQEPQNDTVSGVDDVDEASQEEAAAVSAAVVPQSPPEPEVVDLAGDEPGESETLGENIVELVENEAARKESGNHATPEVSLPSDKSAREPNARSEEATQAKKEPDDAADAEPGLIPDSTGETIFLEIADEVLPPAEEPPKKNKKEAKLETPTEAEALKIERAAQDMATAIEQQKTQLAETQKIKKHKIALAKAQAVKKQKVALAKAYALKKQKMIMAKAAALKRKKAALAKAQALNKQGAAAPNTTAGKPGMAQKPDTNSKMQELLEKYKGQAIGINFDHSADIREAKLVEADSESFSVFVESKNYTYTYPLKTILTIIEGKDGVEVGEYEKKAKFNVVIKVYPLVLF